jgi:hypothetical protein
MMAQSKSTASRSTATHAAWRWVVLATAVLPLVGFIANAVGALVAVRTHERGWIWGHIVGLFVASSSVTIWLTIFGLHAHLTH